MVELYAIHHRIGRSEPTGQIERLRNGKTRRVYKFIELYDTDNGKFTPEEWKVRMEQAVIDDKEEDVLELIEEHCRTHCAWLHSKAEVREHALEVLAGRSFLCGKENWKDVADKIKDTYLRFDFGG